jgi:hypothetical protein
MHSDIHRTRCGKVLAHGKAPADHLSLHPWRPFDESDSLCMNRCHVSRRAIEVRWLRQVLTRPSAWLHVLRTCI